MKNIYKKLFCVLLTLIMALGIVPFAALSVFAEEASDFGAVTVSSQDGNYKISLEKDIFMLGEPIMVTAYGMATNDWVAICPKGAGTYPAWHYLGKSGSGAPYNIIHGTSLEAGEYEIYLVPNGGRGYDNRALSTTITITNEAYTGTEIYPTTDFGDSSLLYTKNDQRAFKKGEPIFVSSMAEGNDWIAIYSDVYDSSYDKYVYVKNMGAQGTEYDLTSLMTFAPGNYLIRLIDKGAGHPYENGTEAAIFITVLDETYEGGDDVDPEPTKSLTVNKTTFEEGEPIMVTAVGGGSDWIGIAEVGGTEAIMWYYVSPYNGYFGAGSGNSFDIKKMADETSYYHGGNYTGTEMMDIPAGEYIICFVENNGMLKNGALYTVPITVVPTSGGGDEVDPDEPVNPNPDPEPEPDVPTMPTLTVEKTTFKLGEPIMVSATYTDDKDWVAIYDSNNNMVTGWYYVKSKGQGVWYDARSGANLSAGSYSIRLIPKDEGRHSEPAARIDIVITNEVMKPSAPSSAIYTPNGNGFATGTVSVTMPEGITGGYNIVMFWANENGILDGYTSLSRFKVTANTTTFTFGKNVVIPEGATELWIYSEQNDLLSDDCVKISLGENADMGNLGTPDTKFFVISDVHIGKDQTASDNFKKMLAEAILLNPNGMPIYIVGDMADHGSLSELDTLMSLYNEVLSANGKTAKDYPLYVAIGNHDYPLANGAFLEFATLPDGTHPTDTSYDFWLDGYHYIFLGSDTPSGLGAWFSDETLAWLDSALSENRDPSRPTFVFLHQSLYNTVAGSLPGEGWHGVSDSCDEQMRAIFAKYPEIMFFNGHSHWTMDSNSNMYEATENLPIHAFNCGSVGYLWSGYNSVGGEHLDGSQGYYVEIYGNKIFVRGRDFVRSEWIPSAQYLVTLADPCDHNYEAISVEYKDGFGENGKVTYKCSACSLERTEQIEPMIYSKGFSVQLDGYGFTECYVINYKSKALYEEVTGKEIKLGFAVMTTESLTSDTFFENGKLSNENGAVQMELNGNDYVQVNISVKNIGIDQLDNGIVISAYISEISGEEEKAAQIIGFVQTKPKNGSQAFEKADGTLYAVSYNLLKGE